VPDYVPHRGKIVVLPEDNVDTDRIMPARFLVRVGRSGYGELLFADVRGASCALDHPSAAGATVMVVGTNFGCGSSREHAVWAIQQAGFHAVVARSSPGSAGFSDIFRQNAANCGLLLIELDEASHDRLVAAGAGAEVVCDLEAQTLEAGGEVLRFEVSPSLKRQLLEGQDLIGTTLELEPAIAAYESRSGAYAPREAPA
jgi:3-isopropylmalate/(R)-2-methylmalate dehydratase small subunit